MIYKGQGVMMTEEGEPALRSCWECNPAHEHLKTVNFLHHCFMCDRYWIFDRFFDFETDEEFDAYFGGELGLKSGDSTSSIDRGYRVRIIEMQFGEDDGDGDPSSSRGSS